jgi:hypothetical protein
VYAGKPTGERNAGDRRPTDRQLGEEASKAGRQATRRARSFSPDLTVSCGVSVNAAVRTPRVLCVRPAMPALCRHPESQPGETQWPDDVDEHPWTGVVLSRVPAGHSHTLFLYLFDAPPVGNLGAFSTSLFLPNASSSRGSKRRGGQTKSKAVRGLLQHRECSVADDRQVSVGEYISPVPGPHGGLLMILNGNMPKMDGSWMGG